jgi:transcriptional regulator
MYVPAHYALDDDAAWKVVGDVGAGSLVVASASGLRSVFAPVVVSADRSVLRGHVSRGNSWWRVARDGDSVLALFNAANSYVSPSLYPTRFDDPSVVPTWDYVICEVAGTIRLHDDVEWVEALVGELTELFERRRDVPWSLSDTPASYVHALARAIVGFEIDVETITGAAKLSQNKGEVDRNSVHDYLAIGSLAERALAQQMDERP